MRQYRLTTTISRLIGQLSPRVLCNCLIFSLSCFSLSALAAEPLDTMSLSVRNTDIAEVMEMLSRKNRINILLSDKVTGKVSVNLYDVSFSEAIEAVASAAGYEVESRNGHYFVISRDDVGRYATGDTTITRTYQLQYAKPQDARDVVQQQLSSFGSVTAIDDRNLLIIEDTPEFLEHIDTLISHLDYRPKQILIEARILEITLDESEAFGIEWSKIFESGAGTTGTRGFSNSGTGFFIEYVGDNFNAFLDALRQNGRTKTLSTPKLLTLENQPASVIVGDRLGYINTVTINQITSENTEFLESGVILEVTATVSADGKILLDVHPEISTGTVTDGVPSQTTTSVRTQLLVPSGGTSFIGGLIKNQVFHDSKDVPVLGNLPIAGRLFSRKETRSVNTEIIVLITPTLVDGSHTRWQQAELGKVEDFKAEAAKGGSIPTLSKPLDQPSRTEQAVPHEPQTP